jgi:hypothetical protein
MLTLGAVVTTFAVADSALAAPIDGPISEADTTTLVSAGAGGAVPNGTSENPELSADGRYIVFTSEARNLVSDDSNGRRDVFWQDQLTRTTLLVSRADGADGAPGDRDSGGDLIGGQGRHRISADGRFVVFTSPAGNLTADGNPDAADVFVRNVVANRTYLASRTDAGAPLSGGGASDGVDISGDGRYVVFSSSAANLPGTQNGAVEQVYRRDLVAGTTLLVSVAGDGTPGAARSSKPVISHDGTKVGFVTSAANLGAPPDDGSESVFVVRDLARGRTPVESRLDGPVGPVETSFEGLMSGDGTHIGWTDGNGDHLYVRDLATGATEQAAVLTDGSELPGFCCFQFAISDDARFVAAYAGSSDQRPVYRRDLRTGITQIVSAPSGSAATPLPSKLHAGVTISGDGRFVAFGSTAALAPKHYAGAEVFPSDVFVRDVSGAPELAPRLSGEARLRPSALRIRVDCGAAFCDGAITGQVTAQSSPEGAGRELFDIQPVTTYTPGGMSTTVALELVGRAAAVSRLEALLQDPGYREHSRVQLELQATGERGTKTASTTLLLAPDSLPAEPEPPQPQPGGSAAPVAPASPGLPTSPAQPVSVKPRLVLTATTKRDRRAPYVYRLRGGLTGAFTRSGSVCSGTVAITIKQGKRTVARKSARIAKNCTYRTTVKVTGRKVKGRRAATLKVTARYGGNGAGRPVTLRPATAGTSVRAR